MTGIQLGLRLREGAVLTSLRDTSHNDIVHNDATWVGGARGKGPGISRTEPMATKRDRS